MLPHFFHPPFFLFCFLLVGHYGSVRVQGKNYPPSPPHTHSVSYVCILVCVCVSNMKGAHATQVQSPVHVLKCSPRDGQHYPCLLHQQGPGARAGSWPFVSKQMEMGRGEVENWKEEEEGQNGQKREGGCRKSQSVLIKCCIEDDIPPQCVSSGGWSPSHSDHAWTICTAGLS